MRTLAVPRYRMDIQQRLGQVRPDSGRRWGRMTAHQMICHLADSFRMVMGQKRVRDHHTLINRTMIKWFALYGPLHWPHGFHTRPEIDQLVGGTKPVDFATDVENLVALMAHFTERPATLEGKSHPVFGPLSEIEWLRWSYLHMDHHLRQFGA